MRHRTAASCAIAPCSSPDYPKGNAFITAWAKSNDRLRFHRFIAALPSISLSSAERTLTLPRTVSAAAQSYSARTSCSCLKRDTHVTAAAPQSQHQHQQPGTSNHISQLYRKPPQTSQTPIIPQATALDDSCYHLHNSETTQALWSRIRWVPASPLLSSFVGNVRAMMHMYSISRRGKTRSCSALRAIVCFHLQHFAFPQPSASS